MTDDAQDPTPAPAAPTPAPTPPPSDRGYHILTRRIPQKDGTERVVREKYNQQRRNRAEFRRQFEARTGKKCTPRQLKRLQRQARAQATLERALLASVQRQQADAADVGLSPRNLAPEGE